MYPYEGCTISGPNLDAGPYFCLAVFWPVCKISFELVGRKLTKCRIKRELGLHKSGPYCSRYCTSFGIATTRVNAR